MFQECVQPDEVTDDVSQESSSSQEINDQRSVQNIAHDVYDEKIDLDNCLSDEIKKVKGFSSDQELRSEIIAELTSIVACEILESVDGNIDQEKLIDAAYMRLAGMNIYDIDHDAISQRLVEIPKEKEKENAKKGRERRRKINLLRKSHESDTVPTEEEKRAGREDRARNYA